MTHTVVMLCGVPVLPVMCKGFVVMRSAQGAHNAKGAGSAHSACSAYSRRSAQSARATVLDDSYLWNGPFLFEESEEN